MSEIKRRVASHWRKGSWVVRILVTRHTIAAGIADEADAWALALAYAKATKRIAYRFDNGGRIAERRDFTNG